MPNPYGLQSQSLCIFVSKRQFIVALFKYIWSRKTCFKILKHHILWPKITYQKNIYILWPKIEREGFSSLVHDKSMLFFLLPTYPVRY
jgi:hypothetical protein